jgi:hypothetical protein
VFGSWTFGQGWFGRGNKALAPGQFTSDCSIEFDNDCALIGIGGLGAGGTPRPVAGAWWHRRNLFRFIPFLPAPKPLPVESDGEIVFEMTADIVGRAGISAESRVGVWSFAELESETWSDAGIEEFTAVFLLMNDEDVSKN